jgi:glycerol-3-phosphate acyltransferase PlsY
MHDVWNIVIAFCLAYLVGSIPFGLLIVWIAKGRDIRTIASGRTGGTNAMRAAGLVAGIFTAVLDVSKGALAVFIAGLILPGSLWVKVVAGLLAIIGHNYSVFLVEKDAEGKINFRGGAGGATALGGAIGLWLPAGLIILPLAVLAFVLVGYASVTTISIAVFATLIFAIRAVVGVSSWTPIAYGAGAIVLVLWSLRPNLERLRNGTERVVGLRARYQRRQKQVPESPAAPQVKSRRQDNRA